MTNIKHSQTRRPISIADEEAIDQENSDIIAEIRRKYNLPPKNINGQNSNSKRCHDFQNNEQDKQSKYFNKSN